MRAVVYFPGLGSADQARFASPNLVFVQQPVEITRVAAEADGAITYASLATTTAFLLAGKPILLLPSHLEQFLLARRVATMGAGICVPADAPSVDFPSLLTQLLTNSLLTANAQAFARKYAAFSQDNVIANLVRRIDELCTVPPLP